MTHRPWTPSEDANLKRWYGNLTNREIAKRLNRTMGAVECRGKFHNLTVPRASCFSGNQSVPERLERMACDPSPMDIERFTNGIRAANRLEWTPWSGADEARREKLRAELEALANPKAEQLELWENVA